MSPLRLEYTYPAGSGSVRGAYIGTGASVIPGVTIGAKATIGAGAVVVRDVPAGETHVGIPAKVINRDKSARNSES